MCVVSEICWVISETVSIALKYLTEEELLLKFTFTSKTKIEKFLQ